MNEDSSRLSAIGALLDQIDSTLKPKRAVKLLNRLSSAVEQALLKHEIKIDSKIKDDIEKALEKEIKGG